MLVIKVFWDHDGEDSGKVTCVGRKKEVYFLQARNQKVKKSVPTYIYCHKKMGGGGE
jgi:hypothetical protein